MGKNKGKRFVFSLIFIRLQNIFPHNQFHSYPINWKLFSLESQKGNIYDIISNLGLNEKNLDTELQKEVMLLPVKL